MHLKITAYLESPVIGELGPLDAQLAWAANQRHIATGGDPEAITDEFINDYDLPLEKWESRGFWGWCVSLPTLDAVYYSAAEFRRRPATTAMAAYTRAKDHHSGLGALKARNTITGATHYRTVSWQAHVTDQQRLENMLEIVTHLGARHRNGFGKVARWEITDGESDGWRDRPLPADVGKLMRVRAPYWHPSERTLCD